MGNLHGYEIDHLNSDGLDNRKCNLRLATRAQNACNARARRNSLSGYKGVTWNKRAAKWRAAIWLNGKERHLGFFVEPEVAHAAYCEASQRLHGEFGREA
jgi:hypothetical protein